MLAVYHLATRRCALSSLAGIPSLIEQAGIMDLPQATVAVLDGNEHSPGQAWKHGRQSVKTLWGELAWQLGGSDAFALVKESDVNGTSPGKEVLRELLSRHAPCVILIDEMVAYVRQFPDNQTLSGGSFESNISFIQALTEAVKLVPNAVVLASLPESEPGKETANVQVGGARGLLALRALENVFGRVQALWKPVATEEAFEIVRRRLFEPVRDGVVRDAVCRAFADTYISEGAKLPAETQERHYYERLSQAYPIHPEVFDRLYEDWTTIDGFQRTRGVLKLMAKVIYRLWKDDNKDLMIMPGSLPLYDGSARNELTVYLPNGWDAVIEKDIDGDRAETTELENKEPRFGQVNAARRAGRTLFLGSAPSSVAGKAGIRGLDRARVLLGCLQPGQTSATYIDALNRLADRLHYLNSSGDKTQEATRFWFDTRANLRREMEDRKRRFDDNTDVRGKIGEALGYRLLIEQDIRHEADEGRARTIAEQVDDEEQDRRRLDLEPQGFERLRLLPGLALLVELAHTGVTIASGRRNGTHLDDVAHLALVLAVAISVDERHRHRLDAVRFDFLRDRQSLCPL
jgi:predicted AAA+ superfamily ATPase